MRRLLAGGLLALLLTGCDFNEGEGVVAQADADRVLTEQRTQVRQLAHHLTPRLAEALGGVPAFAKGSYEGCTTAGIDFTFKNFKYLVQGRVNVEGAGSHLPKIAQLLESEGFEVQQSGSDLSATKDGLTVSARTYPDQPFVLFGVSGPCIDVPEDDREEWGKKPEPDPDVLSR